MDALSKGAASLGGGVASLGVASTSLAAKGLQTVGDKSTGAAKAVLQTAKQELSTIWKDVGGWKFVMSTALVVTYLAVGGAIFMQLELGNEKEQHAVFEAQYQAFNETVEAFKAELTPGATVPADIAEKVDALLKSAAQLGAAAAGASNPQNWIWDFGGSLFFSLTIITTIGYGSYAPATVGGRIFTVFYALIGIPVFLNYLLRFARFTSMTIGLAVRLVLLMNKAATAVTGIDVAGKELTDKRNSAIITGVFTFLVTLAVILGTAAYAQSREGWNFGDSVYYSFITFTTIGLGDFAPSGPQELLDDSVAAAASLGGYIFLIFFGLSATGAFISSCQDFLHYTNDLAKTRISGNIAQSSNALIPGDEGIAEESSPQEGGPSI